MASGLSIKLMLNTSYSPACRCYRRTRRSPISRLSRHGSTRAHLFSGASKPRSVGKAAQSHKRLANYFGLLLAREPQELDIGAMEKLEPNRPLPSAGAPLNRPRNPRRRTLKGALIVFRSGYCTMGCLILNTSDTGALVRPADILLCPNEFVLKPSVGPSRDCEVLWRKGEDLGVRYL